MLALEQIFLIIISIVTLIAVILLISPYRTKIIDYFSSFFRKESYENYCYTYFINETKNLNVDELCRTCLSRGRKIKFNCNCYVVYSDDKLESSFCENRCYLDNNKIWIIKYDVVENKVFIEC